MIQWIWWFFVIRFGFVFCETFELESSNEFNNRLDQTQGRFSVLYVYKPGCPYCAEVEPKLDYVLEQFRDVEMDYFKANGMKLRDLVMELRVTHFPQLFVFDRGTGDKNETNAHGVLRNDLLREDRTVAKLASWISECTGEMPKWSYSRIKDTIRDMETFNSTFPADVIEFLFEEGETTLNNAVCLAFANSWMEAGYPELFVSDIELSILNRLSIEWPQIDFYLFDSSLPTLSQLTNRMQVAFGLPVVFFAYHDKILRVEFWPYDIHSRNREYDYLKSVLENCLHNEATEQTCEEFVSGLPHVYIQDVWQLTPSDNDDNFSHEEYDEELKQAFDYSMSKLYDF